MFIAKRSKSPFSNSCYPVPEEKVDYSPPIPIYSGNSNVNLWAERLSVELFLNFDFLIEKPGKGFFHVLTKSQINRRITQLKEDLPKELADILSYRLEKIFLPSMTKKMQINSNYGLQYDNTIYLYPMSDSLTESFSGPLDLQLQLELNQLSVDFSSDKDSSEIRWTKNKLRDFYLNNTLIHELGHLVNVRGDDSEADENFANYFVQQYGLIRSKEYMVNRKNKLRNVSKRHHKL